MPGRPFVFVPCFGPVEPFVVAPCNRVHTLTTERHVASGNVEDYRALGIEVVQA